LPPVAVAGWLGRVAVARVGRAFRLDILIVQRHASRMLIA
jgi:hypothetical protein